MREMKLLLYELLSSDPHDKAYSTVKNSVDTTDRTAETTVRIELHWKYV